MTEPRRHHYIPKFYLKQWGDKEGRLIAYRWVRGNLITEALHPASTGFQKDLYRSRHIPRALRQNFEKYVTADVDNRADKALQVMVEKGAAALDEEQRLAWAQFIVSLPIRNPEAVADIKTTTTESALNAAYKQAVERHPNWARAFDLRQELKESVEEDPETAFLSANYGLLVMAELMLNPQYQKVFLDMHWWTVDFAKSNFSLITCDRPYKLFRSLRHPRCLVYLPLGPRLGFFASPDKNKPRQIANASVSHLAKQMNRFQVGLAVRHVYATDRQHTPLVQKHLHPLG